jgi:hypothetical protein
LKVNLIKILQLQVVEETWKGTLVQLVEETWKGTPQLVEERRRPLLQHNVEVTSTQRVRPRCFNRTKTSIEFYSLFCPVEASAVFWSLGSSFIFAILKLKSFFDTEAKCDDKDEESEEANDSETSSWLQSEDEVETIHSVRARARKRLFF